MKQMLPTQMIFCLTLGSSFLFAGERPAAPILSTNAPFQQIAPGIFQLGPVRLNKAEQTVRFPAAVNMTNGLVEYFVVTGTGKLHESVLKTEVEPAQIHIAMLLLGAQDASTNAASTHISGNKFAVELSWKNGGVEKHSRGEEWILTKRLNHR